MDPLVEIPRKRWGELLSLYQAKWPDGVVPSCMISLQLACPELGEDFMLKVYCPEGDMDNGFVAVTEQRDNNSYQVMVQPLTSSKAIERALLTTSKIEWNRFIMFPSISPEMKECLERISEQLGVNFTCDDSSKAIKHVMKRDSKPFADLSVPPNTYMGPIKAKDIEIVDKVWAYYNKNSYKLFECLIKHGLTYALYSLNHDILAWTTVNNGGAMGHLYCFEEHRKKGYAEFIMKYVINDLLEKKVDILAFTIEGNVKPQRLFDKLGLEVVGHDYWVFTSKKK